MIFRIFIIIPLLTLSQPGEESFRDNIILVVSLTVTRCRKIDLGFLHLRKSAI